MQELDEDFNARWIEYSMSLFKIPSRNEYKTNRKYTMNRQLEADYRNYLASLLREIYQKGIIDVSPLEENGQLKYKDVTIVKGNVAENYSLDELYTPKTAYEYATTQA